MSSPSLSAVLAFLQEKEFLSKDQLKEVIRSSQNAEVSALLRELVRREWLTTFQAKQIASGQGKDLILGPYRLLEPIGEGGMGKVFKARHVRMDRIVALKIIPNECLANPNALARFDREVRAVAQLSHPNIVTAYEVNQEGDTHYFAMEFTAGIDLARLVKQSGPLPIAQACEFIRQAATGLEHAHGKGLVHRDLKPANLFVGRGSPDVAPVIKILDFGLARFESGNETSTRLTKLGKVLGTVDYMSPEQVGDAREVDIRSDIYSLGCSLFYLLTGQVPFSGDDASQRMIARVVKDAPSLRSVRPDVPAGLEEVVAKMLARNRAERYQKPLDVATALEPYTAQPKAVTSKHAAQTQPDPGELFLLDSPFLAQESIAGAKPAKKKKSKIPIRLGAALVVLTIAIIAGGFLLRSGEQGDPVPKVVKKKPAKIVAPAPPDALRIGDRHYKVFWEKISWTEARLRCQKMGGDLPSVENEAKRSMLSQLKGANKVVWLGGHRTPKGWQWLNGKKIDFELGNSDDPNNNCVAYSMTGAFACRPDSGYHPDYGVKMIEGFICEWAE